MRRPAGKAPDERRDLPAGLHRGAVRGGGRAARAEWLRIAKSTGGRFQQLAALIAAHHPYEVPEITATPISHGSPAYLSWLAEEAVGGR
jgi:hypothetical protein